MDLKGIDQGLPTFRREFTVDEKIVCSFLCSKEERTDGGVIYTNFLEIICSENFPLSMV